MYPVSVGAQVHPQPAYPQVAIEPSDLRAAIAKPFEYIFV